MATAAVVWQQGEPFRLTEIHLDKPRATEVHVRLLAVGMCHTDLNAASGALPFPLPGVLGHEGVGIVEDIGEDVTRVRVGDRVLLTFTSCGRCRGCRSGHPAHCDDQMTLNLFGGRRPDGSTPLHHADGTELNAHFFGQSSFATEAIADERGVIPLPDDLDDATLPVLTPLGCGAQTGAGAILNVLRPAPGSTLAVAGAGAVGLSAVMTAAAMTAVSRVIVIDRYPDRLRLASELGATDTIDTTEIPLDQALLDANVDYAIETTGNTTVLETLIDNLGVAGHVAVIGAPRGGSRASFDVNRLLLGRTIHGVTLGDSEPQAFIPTLLDAWRAGRFPIDRLVRTYPFADINKAAEDAASGRTIKPVLIF
ncbi:MAG TPA: NAD(P)-dependent alcohol dehydrogenase [Pseudonocardiaceae bacterium]|jgi:aryl-alcohol dehydrogenase